VTVVVLPEKRHEEREPWHGLGPVGWIPSESDRETLRYSPESGVIQGSFQYSMLPEESMWIFSARDWTFSRRNSPV
jgi:hypothetical protein